MVLADVASYLEVRQALFVVVLSYEILLSYRAHSLRVSAFCDQHVVNLKALGALTMAVLPTGYCPQFMK